MTASSFDVAARHTLEIEGGFVDDPDDRGGATNWGITEATARAFGYTGHMRDLPKETALAIYKRQYWDHHDLAAVHNQKIAGFIFDTSVNHGQSNATLITQRAIKDLQKQIVVDGVWGPKTLAAVQSLTSKYPDALLGALKTERGLFYKRIIEIHPSQGKFAKGWFKRVA